MQCSSCGGNQSFSQCDNTDVIKCVNCINGNKFSTVKRKTENMKPQI